MDHAYQEAERLLKEHSDKLDNVAKFLIQYEKMDGTIFRQIMESNNFDIDAFIQEHGEKLKRHTMTPAEMIQAAKDAKAAKEAQVQKADMDANTEGTH